MRTDEGYGETMGQKNDINELRVTGEGLRINEDG